MIPTRNRTRRLITAHTEMDGFPYGHQQDKAERASQNAAPAMPSAAIWYESGGNAGVSRCLLEHSKHRTSTRTKVAASTAIDLIGPPLSRGVNATRNCGILIPFQL